VTPLMRQAVSTGGLAFITAATSTEPGEVCDCCWLDDYEHPEVSRAGTVPCGCGEHDINLYRATAIHWEGKHWKTLCAFHEALRRLPALADRDGSAR